MRGVFMLDSFVATVSPMLVMFLCMLTGYVLCKSRIVPENTATVLSKLEINVFLPVLVLNTFLKYCTVESITTQYQTVLYGVLAVGLALVMGIPLSKLLSKEKNERKIYRYSLVIANFGFLGNAIVPPIMGAEAMYSYMLFTIPLNILLYSWAFNSLIPEGQGEKKSMWKNLRNPTSVAMILGIVLGLLGVGAQLPSFVETTLSNLAGCMGPIAMLLTGYVIGGYRLPELLTNKRVYLVTFLRLLILPSAIVGVLWLLGADKLTLCSALFAYASALGLNTVMVPAAYNGDTKTGAGMAMISHVGCVITIPLLYALLLSLLG